MALNVQWNWRMPTVGDPNGPANSVAQGLQTGAEAFAQAMQNRREREQQAQLKQDEMRLLQDKFAHQQNQDELAQRNKNREFWQQKALNDEKIKQAEFEMEQKKKQAEWMEKLYQQWFGETSPELQALRAKYGDNAASKVMIGLNPMLMK